MGQLLSQVGGGLAVGLAVLAAVGLLSAIVVTVIAFIRGVVQRRQQQRDRAAAEARQVLVDVVAAIRQQRQQSAHEARIQLLRAAHAAMQEHERHQRGER